MEKKYPIELRTKWECPDANDARILSGPNIPKPLHGCPPRVFMGAPTWDKVRKRTYYLAKYKCQICGADCSDPGSMDAHELYTIDYEKGTSTFKKVVGICKACHNFYHSGRLVTLYRQKVPLYSADTVLAIVEHGFNLIHEWNEAHPDGPKLKAFHQFIEYLRNEELASKMEELIEKYGIEFWGADDKRMASWGDWKLVFGKKEYPTPYKDYAAWEKAMEITAKNDTIRKMTNPFTGGAYDEIAELVKS